MSSRFSVAFDSGLLEQWAIIDASSKEAWANSGVYVLGGRNLAKVIF